MRGKIIEYEAKTIRNKAIAEGRAEGKAEGRAEGKAEGRAEGKAEGKAEGRAEGIAEMRAQIESANRRTSKRYAPRQHDLTACGKIYASSDATYRGISSRLMATLILNIAKKKV